MTTDMSANTTTSERPKRGRRLESWPKKARRHDVSTKTLDRWAEQGKISKPERINNRKYGDADETPRLD